MGKWICYVVVMMFCGLMAACQVGSAEPLGMQASALRTMHKSEAAFAIDTEDDTPTDVVFYVLPQDAVVELAVVVSGHNPIDNSFAVFTRRVVAEDVAGFITILQTVDTIGTDAASGGFDGTIEVLTEDGGIVVRVTGEVEDTVEWGAHVTAIDFS